MSATDAFSSFGTSFERVSRGALLNFSDLPSDVKSHLSQVYATLCAALAVSAAGVYIDLSYQVGGVLTYLGAMFSVLWLGVTPPKKNNQTSRTAVLCAAAFCQGCSIGQLVGAVISINPYIILNAFLATTACFACFSLAALVSRRRSFLYLGGLLSSAISILMLARLASMFGIGITHSMELYLGLAVFMGYIIFDTQVIVEKAISGNKDRVADALALFTDFVAIFVRLVIILAQQQRVDRRKQEEQRRR